MTEASNHVDRASAWIYSGVWAGLTSLFLVPREPPGMPAGAHNVIATCRPAPGYLRYAKFWFWIGLLPLDIVVSLVWVVIAFKSALAGALLLLPALALIVLPDIVTYIAIHLRYDTTWYVLTDRSMRLRSGVLSLVEVTITYENVQSVVVEQGPVQRAFGIADVVIQTAGGGSGGSGSEGGGGHNRHSIGMSHAGRIRGIDNAEHVRDLIMTRVRASRSAGLGDEHVVHVEHGETAAWSGRHVEVLREIRELLPGAR